MSATLSGMAESLVQWWARLSADDRHLFLAFPEGPLPQPVWHRATNTGPYVRDTGHGIHWVEPVQQFLTERAGRLR